jgi:hypothetical protein
MEPRAKTVFIAGAAYEVPVFWLFCFDPADLATIESAEGDFPTLVTEMARARARLAARAALAGGLFPAAAGAWEEFRHAVEAAAGRKYLKVDAYEVRMLNADDSRGEFAGLLRRALGWFESGEEASLDALLPLAGIGGYDRESGSFPVSENDCPERFLYGWLEE